MKTFTISMVRTYATEFKIDAKSYANAEEKLKNDESRYAEELSQCNVIEEFYQCDGEEEIKDGTLFARKCSKCGCGMNEGYVVRDGDEYFCSDDCMHKIYSPKEWDEMDSDESYYTEWECEKDYEYKMVKGKLLEIDLEYIETLKKPLSFCDVDGSELTIGTKVACIDVDDLDYIMPKGLVLVVTNLVDLESNLIEFKSIDTTFLFYGHRVLKLKL